MNPSSSHPPGSSAPDAASGSRAYTPGLSDGLGDRLMMFDAGTQSSLELLRFKREFSDAPGFEDAVRARIEELSRFKHPSIAPVRTIQALDDGLALVSVNTPGRRLSEMVHVARGAPFAMDLIQQLAPALAALHQQGGRVAHGLLTAERIIITREGRLVVVEHVLATAFEQLRLSPTRLRSELGIAVPGNAEPVGLNQRGDVVQLGFLALSLLLGRRLDPAHFPSNIGTLLDEFTHADAASSAKLRPWLERALQVNERAFTSAEEAHAAFSESEGKPQPRETRPAPPAVTVTKESQVLAFRPSKSDNSSSDAFESKSDVAKADKKESNEPMKIELQKLDPPPAPPPPVMSVASPRVKQGGAGKWIAIAVVLVAVAAGAGYMSGMFSGSTPPSSTSTPPDVTTTTPPPPPFRPEPTQAATPGPATPPTAAPAAQSTPASTAGGTSTPSGGASGAAGTASSGRNAAAAAPEKTDPKPDPPAERPAAAAGGFGAVKVSAPIELKVFENGNLVGSTAGNIAVLQGMHTFEMVNEALAFRVRSTVNVRGGQLTPLAINLPNGKLSINAVPWADVFIDGKAAGQTPLANVPVMIGQHEIVFRHPQLGEERQTVTVKAEGLTKVSATFKQ